MCGISLIPEENILSTCKYMHPCLYFVVFQLNTTKLRCNGDNSSDSVAHQYDGHTKMIVRTTMLLGAITMVMVMTTTVMIIITTIMMLMVMTTTVMPYQEQEP